ncbi:putative amino-acid permease [Colletotrichum fructicola]|uniref:Putative amino-acid permease n=1 Tax=Colletotrichum fructicola (strain Nara gc5) TaxID=1213859 RepID=A0A7J6JKJ4_COLFN|nr:putative amino-acid permease [Colletotrichum fructicola]KAF4490900.1 putative amino-acid permease [Colletotrichum fructicola Nara gc5]KAE9574683.1 putative amino-acid permease [Colletotrichum fructicola]KAF4432795.1 putative amino-acid permease [Colletotrichum fructicola]KAF4882558.1 putative amino-acid permease [Colletotrichum fructicola]KAF4888403.1 putative amino-acid permease [Colletotrichum fructicola]
MSSDNVAKFGKRANDAEQDPSNLKTSMSNAEGSSAETGQLRREFKERHVSMIAVAGAIGTGLIIGSGTGLVRGGPASLLIAYTIIGAVVFFIMTAVGEMATMLPSDKGFAGYATRFVDPALGYATGWNYFLKYAIVLPNNLTAAGIIIQYWRPDLNVSIFVTTFTVAIIAVNVLHVSFFGEAEFWMSTVKLLVIIMLILTCFIISMGGQPSGEVIGFKYWHNPGAFGSYLVDGPTGRFLGFWAAMVQACFAYTGTEVVGVAFGEAPNPRKTIRKAVRQTLWRIVFFYIIGALVLGMSVPYTNDLLIGGTKKSTGAAASPFVIAVQLANIPVFPHVVNGCLLIFVISAANSDIYIGSRTLYGLARDGQAPSIFTKTTGAGVPIIGVAATSVFTALAYMNAAKSSSQVFGYLVSLVTVFGTLNWVSVLVSYIQFTRGMQAQGIPRSIMPYRGPLQPYGSYAALLITVLVVFFNGYNAFIPKFTVSTFMTSYIGIAIYVVNIISYKLYAKTQKVGLGTMDLHSNRLEDDGAKYPSTLEKAASWVIQVTKR